MSAIGDRLRQAAEEADSGKDFTAFAVIVTENSSCRFFLSHIEDEDEARVVCARGLVNTLGLQDNRKEQIDAADVWIKSTLGAPD
jgi:hypothetical protein